MTNLPLTVGAVLKCDWDERPVRVLMFDDVEVLYDSWWPHSNSWGLSSLKGRATYYRVSAKHLLPRSKQIRLEPLTEAERATHRPDLPLRVCRSSQLQWSCETYSKIELFATALQSASPALFSHSSEIALMTPSVFLSPFGPKGSSKAGVLVEAQDKTSFSVLELLWHAQRLQAPQVRDSQGGVGIYRSGFQRGIPSYYLWGSHDRANYLEDPLDM